MTPVIQIYVTHLRGNRYRNEVLNEQGQMIVINEFNLDPDSLQYRHFEQYVKEDASYGKCRNNRIIGEYGNFLHKCFFRNGQEIAQELQRPEYEGGATFEVHLPTGHPELWQVPWEYIWDGSRQKPYALRPDYSFRRVPHGLRRTAPAEPQGHIRVLLVISNPENLKDWHLLELDTEAEVNAIGHACEIAVRDGRLHLRLLEEGNIDQIRRNMREFDPHIIQITSHGVTGEDEIPCLLLEDENGRANPVTAEDLWGAIGVGKSLRLVVLPGCLTGRVPPTDAFSGLATGLLEKRPITVLAIQYPISDEAGHKLAELYGTLADEKSVEEAVAQVRQVLGHGQQRERAAWGVVALYTRLTEDLRLIDSRKDSQRQPEPRSAPFIGGLPVPGIYVKPNGPYRKLKASLRNKLAPFVFLKGRPGSGKSTLIATALERLNENQELDGYIVFSCGKHSDSLDSFLECLVMFFELQNDPKLERLRSLLMSTRHPVEVKVSEWARFARQKRYVFVFDGFEILLKQQEGVPCDISDERMKDWLDEILIHHWGSTTFIFTSSFDSSLFSSVIDGRVTHIEVPGFTEGQSLLLMEKMERTRGATELAKRQAFRRLGGHPLLLWLLNSYLEMSGKDLQAVVTEPTFEEQFERKRHDYIIGKIVEMLPVRHRELLKILSILTGEEGVEQEMVERLGFRADNLQRLLNLRLIEQIQTPAGRRFRSGT